MKIPLTFLLFNDWKRSHYSEVWGFFGFFFLIAMSRCGYISDFGDPDEPWVEALSA